MRTATCLTIAAAILFAFRPGRADRSENRPEDECPGQISGTVSNADIRNCFAREQSRVNAEADALAQQFQTRLLSDATATEKDPVVSGLLKAAASGLVHSQKEWKIYRDEYCRSVRDSWTTGSGAGTAYEECLSSIGKARVSQLKADFGLEKP